MPQVSAEVTQGLAWAGTFKMAQPDVWQLGPQLELVDRATPSSTWPVYGWMAWVSELASKREHPAVSILRGRK